MEDTKQLIKDLVAVPSLSGYEDNVREHITKLWEPLTDECHTSKLGSLHALKKGTGEEPRPSILIATHMDAIGLMVTAVKDGLLRVTGIGGIDHRTLPGLTVTVHTQSGDLPGLVVMPPAHALPPNIGSNTVPADQLWVDTGLPARQVEKQVQLGDIVTFTLKPLDMGSDYISAPALDNRSSVAVLTETLKILQKRLHSWDVWAVATVQEEVGLKGAETSSFDLRPTIGVVVDVTFATGPGAPAHEAIDMDKGPSYDFGPSTHPKLHQAFIDLADSLEMSYNRYAYPRSSGTDADKLQIAAEGIPTMVVSLPLRYMHTPVEMVQTRDVLRIARLLAAFIEQLDEKFIDTLQWDDESEETK